MAIGMMSWLAAGVFAASAVGQAPPAGVATIGGMKIEAAKGGVGMMGVGVGVRAPENAMMLIGASADATFHKGREKEIPYDGVRSEEDLRKLPGYVEVAGTGDLVTSAVFGDARFHVEWYAPPGGEGQMAGNSGVYVQERYEIQILGTLAADKLGREEKNDEAGAIYKVRAPDVNASTGPGTWQAYDIWFRAPRFENEKKVSDAHVTVYWNGVLVHNDAAISGPTTASAASGENHTFAVQTGGLRLQDHETKAEGSVRFRNVWVAPLEDVKYVAAGEWERPLDAPVGADGLPQGWVIRGGQAKFRMEGKTVVGTSAPNSANTFLVSRREYEDFEMLLDFEVDAKLNSGVQIRSEVVGGYDLRKGVVRGWQVEIDPRVDRAYTGGIYEEQGRGWLERMIDSPQAQKAFRNMKERRAGESGVPDEGEANHLRILATGPIVRTWINGVPAAVLFDEGGHAGMRGRFGLQVHGVGAEAEGREVRFWNMRVREMKRGE